ncbi:MAG: signal peptidase I, partial [Phaeodactylibacter sp.]|nr:signal peptidase I [Phaeodactylibacter sp.]
YRAMSLPSPYTGPATEQTYIGRIVAKGGDVVQLIDGRAQVNGISIDSQIPLKFLYLLNENQAQANQTILQQLGPSELLEQTVQGAILAFLEDGQYEAFPNSDRPARFDPPIESLLDGTPAATWVQPDWTFNNYGPITVPANHFFILGDNRSNSEDSRHRGPIPNAAVIATLFD